MKKRVQLWILHIMHITQLLISVSFTFVHIRINFVCRNFKKMFSYIKLLEFLIKLLKLYTLFFCSLVGEYKVCITNSVGPVFPFGKNNLFYMDPIWSLALVHGNYQTWVNSVCITWHFVYYVYRLVEWSWWD